MVEIVQDGHKALRKIAEEITEKEFGTTKLAQTLADMNEALNSQDDGVALAAPQIAITKRIFVVSLWRAWSGGDCRSRAWKKMDEGCLSVRPLYGIVKRSSRVTVTAQDEKGEQFIVSASGLLAQIFQHEIDHLDGTLFIDKATNVAELKTDNA